MDRYQFFFCAPYDVVKETGKPLFTQASYFYLHFASKLLGSCIQIQIF